MLHLDGANKDSYVLRYKRQIKNLKRCIYLIFSVVSVCGQQGAPQDLWGPTQICGLCGGKQHRWAHWVSVSSHHSMCCCPEGSPLGLNITKEKYAQAQKCCCLPGLGGNITLRVLTEQLQSYWNSEFRKAPEVIVSGILIHSRRPITDNFSWLNVVY